MSDRRWRKSSHSGNQGDCVEIALGEHAEVRDTKDRDGGQLIVTATAWHTFTANLKRNH
ncbi:DUF397 domain-containing protein [Amycolatopsis palatopharyngis]|uniref:DUF397 domain-containing protein n=1 Tax=Amycolatopsis palatopharyngis TaxID=187982 RepID=UPI000E265886|nr:DUF397 domain-containing protein [Amycolatopsis palatopharyngis]